MSEIIDSGILFSVVVYGTDEKDIKRVIESCRNYDGRYIISILNNGFCDYLTENFFQAEDITVVNSKKNIGFGAGHNKNFKMFDGKYEYISIVNPDVSFELETINILKNHIESCKYDVMVAPLLRYEDGGVQYSCRLLPTPISLGIRRFFTFLKIGHFSDYVQEMHAKMKDDVVEAPFIHGAFYLLKSSLFNKIGGYDDRYFLYMEDVDLCRSVSNIGGKIHCLMSASLIHRHGKASYFNRKLMLYHMTSAFKYFTKWGWFLDSGRRMINRKLK